MERYHFSDKERTLLERSRVPFAIYQFLDKRVVTLILSDGFCDLFGYRDPAKAYYDMDHDMYKDTHPDDVARIADAAFRFATQGGKYEVIYRTRCADSSLYKVVHAIGEHVYTPEGTRLAQVWYTDEGSYAEGNFSEGTELNRVMGRALHEESLLKASYYDYLTGLPSMTYFFELAEAGRERLVRQGRSPALLFVDLSGMKFFNRRHGFGEGDKLLQAFAKVLTRYFSNENCCRFGGDHFVVFAQEEGLEETLEDLFRDVEKLNDGKSLSVRVGIYLDQTERVDVSTACDRAKVACDALRRGFQSCYNYFNIELRNNIQKYHYVVEHLDQAIREKWIKVYYQPIIRAVNGRVCDEEALSRWSEPGRGLLPPAEFIPVLEDTRLIYKLDLYVLEEVLQKLKDQAAEGLHLVPQSINLSRGDFDACDMVEEVRRRVDEAGIGRDKIIIELTESVIGSDFDFIKKEIERFHELGFRVWMDDFGSGYSSLDVLQSIDFDLIKFDMRFLQKFNESDKSKILLSELVRMATSLGVDTLCEGVETEEQRHFLAEIGCTKLQGYLYGKPIPLEEILQRYREGRQIGFEDPRALEYYETIGRVNLYDLSVISQEVGGSLKNVFNTLPMAVMEVRGGSFRYLRFNRSFKEFVRRSFGIEVTENADFIPNPAQSRSAFLSAIWQCCRDGSRTFVDEVTDKGASVHSFLRRLGTNPVSGVVSVAAVVLSISDEDRGASYANIARALAADYIILFDVDLETERYTEYASSVGGEELTVTEHGDNFFATSLERAVRRMYPEDLEAFTAAFTKENLLHELEKQGTFSLSYRLLMEGKPVYMNLKAMHLDSEGKHLVIGVSNVDSQMRQKETLDRVRQDQVAYTRIMALSENYLCLFTVDPVTLHYMEYGASQDYRSMAIPREGEDFFADSHREGRKVVYPEDLPRFLELFTKENVLREIRERGLFIMRYRLVMHDRLRYVSLRAAMVTEGDGEKLIVGINERIESSRTDGEERLSRLGGV